jgi:Domain of unknown function (DUF397)
LLALLPGHLQPRDSKGIEADHDDPARASWRKSTHRYSNDDCVETASLPGGRIAVRDNKDKAGPVLLFTPSEWRAFLGAVKNGEFDSLQ